MNHLLQVSLAGLLICSAGPGSAEETVNTAIESAVEAGFSELEREMIGDYFEAPEDAADTLAATGGERSKSSGKPAKNKQGGKGNLPAGLAKRERLPPGLERQLQKNGALPPGLAKRGLPADLERQLPPVKEGYERQIIEDSVIILVDQATGRIADIITDAIVGRE